MCMYSHHILILYQLYGITARKSFSFFLQSPLTWCAAASLNGKGHHILLPCARPHPLLGDPPPSKVHNCLPWPKCHKTVLLKSYHYAVSGCNSFLHHNYYKSLWTCGTVYNPVPYWPEQRLGREAWRAQVLPGSCCSCCSCYSCSGCLGASWVVVASEAFCTLCTQLLGKCCKFTSTRLWTK